MSNALLSVEALEIGYASKRLLAPVDVEFEPGQFWCVLGRNGSGKTTLLRTLLGLLPPLGGARVSRPGLRLGYLPQKSSFDDLYPMSTRDVVLMGAERNLGFLKRRSTRGQLLAETALAALELEGLATRRYRELSEGQKQRVLLARLSAGAPELAFLDEPTTAMDHPTEQRAFQYMAELCLERGATLLVVTHDFQLARAFAGHALFIDDAKREVLVGPIARVFESHTLKQRYGFEATGGKS